MSEWKNGRSNSLRKGTRETYRAIKFAGDGHEIENGARVEEIKNFGASPGFHASEWPVVEAHVPLLAGREDLQAELAQLFRDTIDAFIEKHALALQIPAERLSTRAPRTAA